MELIKLLLFSFWVVEASRKHYKTFSERFLVIIGTFWILTRWPFHIERHPAAFFFLVIFTCCTLAYYDPDF